MMKIELNDGAFLIGRRLGILELVRRDLLHHVLGDRLGDLRPDVDDLVVALAVGDETFGVLLLDLGDFLLAPRRAATSFDGGMTMSSMQIEMPALRRERVTGRAQRVGEEHRRLLAGLAIDEVDQLGELLLAHHLVDRLERDLRRADVLERARDRPWSSTSSVPPSFLSMRSLIARLEVDLAVVVRHAHFVDRPNTPRTARPFLSSWYVSPSRTDARA